MPCPAGSRIGEVLALDPDSALNGQVVYSLEEGGDSVSFSVDVDSGSVIVKISLHAKVDVALLKTNSKLCLHNLRLKVFEMKKVKCLTFIAKNEFV